jgi:hypothetical protein
VNLSLEQIARALNGEIRNGQVLAPGPGHSAVDRSMSVKISDSGDDIVVYSFAGDDPIARKKYAREKCGIQFRRNGNGRADVDLAKLMQEAIASQSKSNGKLIDSYHYTDENGVVRYEVLRYEPKGFRQRRPNGNGGQIWNLDGVERLIYRWPEVLASPSKQIFVTEGEKDTNKLWEKGLPATTAQGSKWTPSCVRALAGYFLVILADNDEPGRKKALEAARALYPVATGIRIVGLPGLNEGGDVSDWFDAGHTRQEFLDFCNAVPDWHPDTGTTEDKQNFTTGEFSETKVAEDDSKPLPTSKALTVLTYRRHRDANNPAPSYLVKNLLPETGTGLLSGQSGTYKSFVGIKLAGAIGTGQPFAGYAIKRQGAALIFASEGAGELPIRLEALSEAEHGGKILPIYYCDAAVRLLDKSSVATVIATAKAIADEAQKDYKLPLVLILFDTVIAAAQFAKAGDENDAAVGQKLMAALGEISRATGAFVLGIDHFGKAVETGTRGSSAKEASADVVLALLADKALSGEVTAPRLCIRKRRGGPAGVEHPFTIKIVPLSQDEDGEDITSLAIDFSAAVPPPASEEAGKWTRSLRLLRKILMTLLATAGEQITPFADGPAVLAVRVELVRTEFFKQHPAEQADTKRKAFDRAVSRAQDDDLIGVREVSGTKWLWLLKQ